MREAFSPAFTAPEGSISEPIRIDSPGCPFGSGFHSLSSRTLPVLDRPLLHGGGALEKTGGCGLAVRRMARHSIASLAMELPVVLSERLGRIRLFLCDVDGVLTEARVTMGGGASEQKVFHIRDGLGLRLLQVEGIRVGWVSARPSEATTERANDLKIDYMRQSSTPKVTLIEEIQREMGVRWEETLYMGDDVVDLGALKRAGFAAVPADAIHEARSIAHYVCRREGGCGAVREVVDLVLKAQGRWDAIIAKYTS